MHAMCRCADQRVRARAHTHTSITPPSPPPSYSCAEHWMMAEKARLFGDEETRARIFQASKPDEMKGGSFRIFLCFELVVSIE